MAPRLDFVGVLVVLWAVGGVLALLGEALFSLTPLALEALRSDLSATHWGVAAVWVPFMAFTEGYRGFQRRFSPRAVRRAFHLARNRRPLLVFLAPLHAMGLVHATRRRLVGSWVLVVAIVALVVAIRALPQPWRGIIDLGVVVGLGWGAASTLWCLISAFLGREPAIDPELPPKR